MKRVFQTLPLLVLLIPFAACEKEDVLPPVDALTYTGVLGEWKLELREFGGISDMAVPCCDYLEFSTDGNETDLKGLFSARGPGYEVNGIFELDWPITQLVIQDENEQDTYGFVLTGERFELSYTVDGNEVVEVWRKTED